MADSSEMSTDVPLVVIGASAGGLEPLESFFANAPEESGWTFVVIQHLSPDYKSMMDELLGRKSRLRIRHIENGLKLEADTIYLNRPSVIAELDGDEFRTHEFTKQDHLPRLPIDAFFRSVARRDVSRTVAVILSGSGSDGSRGARALRDAGAIVLVQSPSESSFSSMPLAAISEGAVDRVLKAKDMPRSIHEFMVDRDHKPELPPAGVTTHAAIFRLLEDAYQVDFSAYKSANVRRRVERRRLLRGIDDPEDYLALLSESRSVLDELYHDLLIGVTEFYRDAGAMEALRTKALDVLAADKSTDKPIRIWVPACASGEEAYTIAIELSEALAKAGSLRRFRIIASDVHRTSLERASAGIYSEESVARLPKSLLSRYFEKNRDQYVVDPMIRQKIIFSTHDVLSDPPFMNLDMISCRNLFIYFQDEAQARVLSMFLFGLRQDGFLLLGSSESLGRFTDEFKVVDNRWRLFRKSSHKKIVDRRLMPNKLRSVQHEPVVREQHIPRRDRSVVADIAEIRNRDTLIKSYDALLKKYAPSSILVAADGSVLGWFGAASAFIDTMNNLADWTVEDIVHKDLHFSINVATEKLRQGQLEPYNRIIEVDMGDGKPKRCTIRIEALDQVSRNKIMLVGLSLEGELEENDVLPEADGSGVSREDVTVVTRRIQELERDLRLTEETLQHVTERLEASGEELQASNEELQASNEELQASNEELQSSNEELHAVNEELVSVSAEHERKIALLSELNASTELVLKLLRTGVIFVDLSGRIRRFSRLVAEEYHLEAHDVDRSLNVVGPRLEFVQLSDLVADVVKTAKSRQVSGEHNGHSVTVHAHPTYDSDNATMDGVLLIIA